jgi:hypothetical protein
MLQPDAKAVLPPSAQAKPTSAAAWIAGLMFLAIALVFLLSIVAYISSKRIRRMKAVKAARILAHRDDAWAQSADRAETPTPDELEAQFGDQSSDSPPPSAPPETST